MNIFKNDHVFYEKIVEKRSSARSNKPTVTPELMSNEIAKRAFNFKHPDGRIHSGDPSGNIAVTCSPYHHLLRSQIEDKVWPHVNELLKKGYLTISSCEGHNGSPFSIILAFGDLNSAESFIQLLNKLNIAGLYCRSEEKCINLKAGRTRSGIKFDLANNHDPIEEAKHLNLIFLRKYKEYFYVEFGLFYKLETGNFRYLKNLYQDVIKLLFLKRSQNQLLKFLSESLPEYIG